MQAKLSRYVTAPFWLATVVLLALTVLVAWYVYDVNRRLSAELEADVDSVKYAEELALGVREIRTHLNRFLLTRDTVNLDAIPAIDVETQSWLKKAAATIRTEMGREYINHVQRAYAEFQTQFPLARQMSAEERFNAINDIKDNLFNATIIEYSNRFLDQKQELVKETVQKNNAFAFQLSLALIALGVCGASAGGLVGYMWSTSLRRTVVQLSLPIHNTEGKLEEVIGPVTVRGMPTSFEELQGSLDRVAGQVTKVVERLQRSQRETLRAEQLAAVGQMAAGMAHELRNPLTSVKILIQAASERRSLGPRDLVVLEQEVTRLEQLIQTFLDFARPPQTEKQRLDLRHTVQDTVQLVTSRADRVAVQIVTSLPAKPAWIMGDATQMHQLLLNLLINALDAIGRAGQIQIELATGGQAGHAGDAGTIELRVSDNGCGLPSELGEKIFEPFVSTKQTGIGMGLSICRRIVEDHGGQITAHSATTRGTVVQVSLPAVPVETLAAIS